MPVFQVELLAFGKPGEIREVEISDEEANADTVDKLEAIFKFGQNEFQPRRHPSVSVGDVIRMDGEKFLVCRLGFRKLSNAEYQRFVALDRRDRHFDDLVGQPNF